MILSRHCKPCNINWDTDDEPFEFCPMCGTELYAIQSLSL